MGEGQRPYFENTLKHINNIANQAHELGTKFVLVITPRYHHWNANECADNWERMDYSVNETYQYEYFRFFEESRSTINYDVVNLLPAFQETKEFPLVFKDDPHWNERGHAFVAEALAKVLRKASD